MVKLVVCDVDGTLIGRDEILADKAIQLSKKLREKGILFTIATGRVEEMADKFVEGLNIDIPYITGNGVTIIDSKKVYMRNTVPLKGLKDIMEKADSLNMTLVYSVEGKEYVVKETPWILKQREEFDRYHDMSNLSDEEMDDLDIDKLMIMDDVRDGDIAILEEMATTLSDQYGYTRYTNKSIEIVNKNSTKGTALKKLAEILNIDTNHILSIGDHMNDIELLQTSGYSGAVGNAQDALKEIADYVSTFEQIDGVVDIVEHFVKD